MGLCIRKKLHIITFYLLIWRLCKSPVTQGPVARSLVSANRWLRGIKMYRFPWYLTLVSTNHASSNPGQVRFSAEQFIIVFCFCLSFYQIYFLLALSSLSLCFKRLYFTLIFSETTVPNSARGCGFPFMHCESNKFVLEVGAKSSIRNT